jgi:hypothetical protein
MRVTLRWMLVERAEPPREVDLLLRRQALVPEDENVMVQMRSVNADEVRFIDRTGRVQARDLGAERIRKGTDHEGQGLSSFSGAELFEIDLSLTGSVAAGRSVVNCRCA